MNKWMKIGLISGIGLLFLIGVSLDLSNRWMIRKVQRNYGDTEIENVQWVDVDGWSMAYRMYGDNHDDVLVLIHGFMGSSFDFHDLAEQLAKSHRVLSIDLIGFGLSDKPVDYDYSKANQATMLARILDALEIEQYVLGGHSMGGEVALRHAAMYPDRVERLILFASAGIETSENRVLPRLFYHLIFKNYFIQRTVFMSVFADPTYQSADRFDPMFWMNSQIPAATIQAFSKWPDADSVLTLIETLPMPTLIIYGEIDTWTPKENGQRLAAVIPDSRLVLLEDVGHMPFIEGLKETLTYVQHFLEES